MGSVKKYSRRNTYIKNNLTFIQLRTMKAGVLTKLRLIALLSSLLFLWDDKTTLAGSVMHSKGKVILGETHDNSQFPKFLVLDKTSRRKSSIEIEGKTRRKESTQKQTGSYTKGCRDVTVGECSLPVLNLIFTEFTVTSVQNCQNFCENHANCMFFRFDGHNCSGLATEYQRNCNVKAGPPDTEVYDCIGITNGALPTSCNSFLQEDCEYLGETINDTSGLMDNDILCQRLCEAYSDCKYWIYHEDRKRCILKKDSNRNCKTWGGNREPEFNYCKDALKIELKDI